MNLTTPIEPIIPFTIDSCRTLCENATFQTNYEFMILFGFAFISYGISRMFEEFNINETKYFNKKLLEETGFIFLTLGLIYYLYLKITGGLL